MRICRLFPVTCLIASFCLSLSSSGAEAQLYGLFHPAKPVRIQSLNGGVFLLLAGGADVGVVGQIRYGAGRNLGIGGKLGFLSEGDGGIMLGGDVMGLVVQKGKDSPFNLSVDGSIELFAADKFTIIALSGTGIIDNDIRLENGKMLRPYGGLALNIVNFNPDSPVVESKTNLEISILGGVVYEISSQIDFLGEIQISSVSNSDVGINAGLIFR